MDRRWVETISPWRGGLRRKPSLKPREPGRLEEAGVFQRRGGSLYGTNEGKSWEAGTGMGRQGPCPGVLTQENCLKVTQSVEDAEIKTNVLKQNSALLEVRGEGVGEDGQTVRRTRYLK